MKNSYIKAFWIGFAVTVGMTVWIYWILRRKRVIAPKPIVVTRRRTQHPQQAVSSTREGQHTARVSDPLEDIKGIGPVFANRLNEAGILTFRQLASASPDDVTRITGVTRWDPADWISEAAELAADQ